MTTTAIAPRVARPSTNIIAWLRAAALAGATGGLTFALLHQVFVAFAPAAFASVLPGIVFGLAFAPAFLATRHRLGPTPRRQAIVFGASLWTALLPFFAVVLWGMDGRVWADGPLPAARPFLTLAPLLGGAAAGALLSRSGWGAVATAAALWLLSFAIGAFLLVETRPGVFAAMGIVLPTLIASSYVLARITDRDAARQAAATSA